MKSLHSSTSNFLDVMILIPEGLVALVIGGKGRQIKSFREDSGAQELVVN
jgi:hypothetical protein